MTHVTVSPRSDPKVKFELIEINGRRFDLGFYQSFIRNIPSLKLRDDDVMICGYMRSVGWGSWFENIESWERALHEHPDHPILVVYYEDLIQDTVGEIIKIKNFLDIDRDEEFCKNVADKTQFEKMLLDKEKYTERYGGEIVHFNKGIIGNWKTMFTVSMSEEFDQLYERKMSGSRFRDRYSRSGI